MGWRFHWAARAIDNVLPQPLTDLSRQAVPGDATYNKRDRENDDQLRQENFSPGWGFSYHIDCFSCMSPRQSGYVVPGSWRSLIFWTRLSPLGWRSAT
jgi:hypothetical protein